MNIPASNSYLWIFARQLVIAAILLGFTVFAYHNKMSPTDIVMILTTLSGIFGVDLVKHNVAPPPSTEGPPPDVAVRPRLSGDQ